MRSSLPLVPVDNALGVVAAVDNVAGSEVVTWRFEEINDDAPRARWPVWWLSQPTYAHVNPMGGSVGGLPMLPPVGFSCA